MSAKFYHGTTKELADKILVERRFKISRNPYDWLGAGVYFYQDAPIKALAWADRFSVKSEKRGTVPVVLEVDLDLGSVFDLFLPESHQILKEAYELTGVRGSGRGQLRPVLRNHKGERFRLFSSVPVSSTEFLGNNYVDAMTIRRALSLIADAEGSTPKCVRQFFWEGQELYAGSYFFDHSNIQLCIPGGDSDPSTESYVGFDDPIFLSTPSIHDFGIQHDELLDEHVRWPI